MLQGTGSHKAGIFEFKIKHKYIHVVMEAYSCCEKDKNRIPQQNHLRECSHQTTHLTRVQPKSRAAENSVFFLVWLYEANMSFFLCLLVGTNWLKWLFRILLRSLTQQNQHIQCKSLVKEAENKERDWASRGEAEKCLSRDRAMGGGMQII